MLHSNNFRFNDETSFSVLPGYSSTSSARERRAGVPFSRNGLCCRAVALSSLVDDDVAKVLSHLFILSLSISAVCAQVYS